MLAIERTHQNPRMRAHRLDAFDHLRHHALAVGAHQDGLGVLGAGGRQHIGARAVAVVDLETKAGRAADHRSEEQTSELQSLMRISYAVLCLKKKKNTITLMD